MKSLVLWLAMSVVACCQTIDPSTVELTAQGSGYYRVYVDDTEVSKHTSEREAAERAVRELAGNPGASVRFVHDYSVTVTASTLQPTPTPDPVPDPDPIPGDYLSVADFELIGGAKIAQEFPRGGLAIDFANGKAFSSGHSQRDEVHEYVWSGIGQGDDIASWPELERVTTHARFWGRGDARDFDVRDGLLWVSPRVFYDTAPVSLILSGKNLSTGEITTIETGLSQPGFGGGFISGHPTDWLIGCGGYQSGQGSKSGPTVARIDGTILLDQASHGIMDFAARTPRPANYSVHSDSWIGLAPRDIDGDGEVEGAWAADRILGGGIWTPRGVLFWAILGTGELLYSRQSETFGTGSECWIYVYDPQTYKLIGFEPWPYGEVHGSEIGHDGTIYLLTRRQWKVGMYNTGSVIKAFSIIGEN